MEQQVGLAPRLSRARSWATPGDAGIDEGVTWGLRATLCARQNAYVLTVYARAGQAQAFQRFPCSTSLLGVHVHKHAEGEMPKATQNLGDHILTTMLSSPRTAISPSSLVLHHIS
jgi:hypothetical protein